MGARTFVGDSGGTARLPTRIFVGDSGGTARLIKRIFVGDSGGTARLVYVYATASLPSSFSVSSSSAAPSSAIVSLSLNSSGAYSASGDSGSASGTWLTAGTNSDFEARMTGTGDSPGTLNTWQALSTTRSWGFNSSTSGLLSFSGTLEIRRVVDSVVVASSTVSLSVFVS